MFKRVVSFFVIFSFLSTQVIFPASSFAQSLGRDLATSYKPQVSDPKISIPKDLGEIEEMYVPRADSRLRGNDKAVGNDNKLIAFIQTAHANTEAQKSIEGILEKLTSSFGPTLVALEGAEGSLKPKNLQIFSDSKLNNSLRKNLLEKGELTGAESFALQHPDSAQFIGVDDAGLYRSNLESYRTTYALRNDSLAWLQNINTDLKELKNWTFSKELREFDKARESFHREVLSTYDYLLFLSKWALEKGIVDLEDRREQKDFPILTRILALQKTAAQVQGFGKQLENEIKDLTAKLKKGGVEASFLAPLENLPASLPRGGSRQYFEELFFRSLHSKVPIQWNNYSAFKIFTEYSVIQEEIDGVRFFKEINSLEEVILKNLGLSVRDKAVFELSQDSVLLERLLKLEASKEEVESFNEKKESLTVPVVNKRLDSLIAQFPGFKSQNHKKPVTIAKIQEALTQAKTFYSLASQRDEALLKNTLVAMEQKKLEKAVLITGGFHSHGIRKLLRDQKIPYVLISPKIKSEFTTEKYEKIMMGDLFQNQSKANKHQKVEAASLLQDAYELLDPMNAERPFRAITEGSLEVLAYELKKPISRDLFSARMDELKNSAYVRDTGEVVLVPAEGDLYTAYFQKGRTALEATVNLKTGRIEFQPSTIDDFEAVKSKVSSLKPQVSAGASLGSQEPDQFTASDLKVQIEVIRKKLEKLKPDNRKIEGVVTETVADQERSRLITEWADLSVRLLKLEGKSLGEAERRFNIVRPNGLYGVSGDLAKLAQEFQSRIWITNQTTGDQVDAKDSAQIDGTMLSQPEMQMILRAEGPDALTALEVLTQFLEAQQIASESFGASLGRGAETKFDALKVYLDGFKYENRAQYLKAAAFIFAVTTNNKTAVSQVLAGNLTDEFNSIFTDSKNLTIKNTVLAQFSRSQPVLTDSYQDFLPTSPSQDKELEDIAKRLVDLGKMTVLGASLGTKELIEEQRAAYAAIAGPERKYVGYALSLKRLSQNEIPVDEQELVKYYRGQLPYEQGGERVQRAIGIAEDKIETILNDPALLGRTAEGTDQNKKMIAKLLAYGKGGVFYFWNDLSLEEKQVFIQQLHTIDLDEVEKLYQQFIVKGEKGVEAQLTAENTKAPKVDDLTKGMDDPANKNAARIGRHIFEQGKIAFLELAGGSGSRLKRPDDPKRDDPKIMMRLGLLERSLARQRAEKIRALAEEYGMKKDDDTVIPRPIPWIIMTSDVTHEKTEAFMKKNLVKGKYFGLVPEEWVKIARQSVMPQVTNNGEFILEKQKNKITVGGFGHGDARDMILRDKAIQDWLISFGVEYVGMLNVDNAPVPGEAEFGYHVLSQETVKPGVEHMSVIAVEKTNPEEKVGMAVRLNNKDAMIEYNQIKPALLYFKYTYEIDHQLVVIYRTKDGKGDEIFQILNQREFGGHLKGLKFSGKKSGEMTPDDKKQEEKGLERWIGDHLVSIDQLPENARIEWPPHEISKNQLRKRAHLWLRLGNTNNLIWSLSSFLDKNRPLPKLPVVVARNKEVEGYDPETFAWQKVKTNKFERMAFHGFLTGESEGAHILVPRESSFRPIKDAKGKGVDTPERAIELQSGYERSLLMNRVNWNVDPGATIELSSAFAFMDGRNLTESVGESGDRRLGEDGFVGPGSQLYLSGKNTRIGSGFRLENGANFYVRVDDEYNPNAIVTIGKDVRVFDNLAIHVKGHGTVIIDDGVVFKHPLSITVEEGERFHIDSEIMQKVLDWMEYGNRAGTDFQMDYSKPADDVLNLYLEFLNAKNYDKADLILKLIDSINAPEFSNLYKSAQWIKEKIEKADKTPDGDIFIKKEGRSTEDKTLKIDSEQGPVAFIGTLADGSRFLVVRNRTPKNHPGRIHVPNELMPEVRLAHEKRGTRLDLSKESYEDFLMKDPYEELHKGGKYYTFEIGENFHLMEKEATIYFELRPGQEHYWLLKSIKVEANAEAWSPPRRVFETLKNYEITNMKPEPPTAMFPHDTTFELRKRIPKEVGEKTSKLYLAGIPRLSERGLYVVKKLIDERWETIQKEAVYELMSEAPPAEINQVLRDQGIHASIYSPQIFNAGPNTWAGDEDGIAIVYPFVPGSDWSDHLRSLKALSAPDYLSHVLNVMIRVSRVASVLEKNGLKNPWDLNPGNIMLTPSEDVVLIDYEPMSPWTKSTITQLDGLLKNALTEHSLLREYHDGSKHTNILEFKFPKDTKENEAATYSAIREFLVKFHTGEMGTSFSVDQFTDELIKMKNLLESAPVKGNDGAKGSSLGTKTNIDLSKILRVEEAQRFKFTSASKQVFYLERSKDRDSSEIDKRIARLKADRDSGKYQNAGQEIEALLDIKRAISQYREELTKKKGAKQEDYAVYYLYQKDPGIKYLIGVVGVETLPSRNGRLYLRELYIDPYVVKSSDEMKRLYALIFEVLMQAAHFDIEAHYTTHLHALSGDSEMLEKFFGFAPDPKLEKVTDEPQAKVASVSTLIDKTNQILEGSRVKPVTGLSLGHREIAVVVNGLAKEYERQLSFKSIIFFPQEEDEKNLPRAMPVNGGSLAKQERYLGIYFDKNWSDEKLIGFVSETLNRYLPAFDSEDIKAQISENYKKSMQAAPRPPTTGRSLGALPPNNLRVSTVDLAVTDEVEQLRYVLGELENELRVPGSSRLPKVSVVSDQHGTIDKFDALIVDAIKSVLSDDALPHDFKLNPNEPLDDQLSIHNISLQSLKGKIYFFNLGDFMDRGPAGVKIFRRSLELINVGLSEFVIGNHDLWEFMNLQGFHLPWYDNYNFYNYTDDYDGTEGKVSLLVEQYHKDLNLTRTKKWWAERLAEFIKYQGEVQKTLGAKLDEEVSGKIGPDGKRLPGTGLFVQVSSSLTSKEQEKLWGYFRGFNPDTKIEVYMGVRGVGIVSMKWWEDLLEKFKKEYVEIQKDPGFNEDLPSSQAWQRAMEIMEQEIIPVLRRNINSNLSKATSTIPEGKWWWRVFEAINYQNYTSPEWWAKDWSSHKDWGTAVLDELNEGIAKDDPRYLTQANYLDNRVLRDIGDFFRNHFNLYARDIYGNTFMHAFLPVDKNTGEFFFTYKGAEYRGKGDPARKILSVWKGLERITSDVKDRNNSLSDIYEALSLVNRWYADNTTEAKASNVAAVINRIGPTLFAERNGFNRLFTGHIPFYEFSKLSSEKRGVITGFQGGNRIIFTDHGMGKKFGSRGGRVDVSPQGLLLRGYEHEASINGIIDNPRTVMTKSGPGGSVEEVLFENPGIPKVIFLPRVTRDLKGRLFALEGRLADQGKVESWDERLNRIQGTMQLYLQDFADPETRFNVTLKEDTSFRKEDYSSLDSLESFKAFLNNPKNTFKVVQIGLKNYGKLGEVSLAIPGIAEDSAFLRTDSIPQSAREALERQGISLTGIQNVIFVHGSRGEFHQRRIIRQLERIFIEDRIASGISEPLSFKDVDRLYQNIDKGDRSREGINALTNDQTRRATGLVKLDDAGISRESFEALIQETKDGQRDAFQALLRTNSTLRQVLSSRVITVEKDKGEYWNHLVAIHKMAMGQSLGEDSSRVVRIVNTPDPKEIVRIVSAFPETEIYVEREGKSPEDTTILTSLRDRDSVLELSLQKGMEVTIHTAGVRAEEATEALVKYLGSAGSSLGLSDAPKADASIQGTEPRGFLPGGMTLGEFREAMVTGILFGKFIDPAADKASFERMYNFLLPAKGLARFLKNSKVSGPLDALVAHDEDSVVISSTDIISKKGLLLQLFARKKQQVFLIEKKGFFTQKDFYGFVDSFVSLKDVLSPAEINHIKDRVRFLPDPGKGNEAALINQITGLEEFRVMNSSEKVSLKTLLPHLDAKGIQARMSVVQASEVLQSISGVSFAAKLAYQNPKQLGVSEAQAENFSILNTLMASTLASFEGGYSNQDFPRELKEFLVLSGNQLSWNNAVLEYLGRLGAALQAYQAVLKAA